MSLDQAATETGGQAATTAGVSRETASGETCRRRRVIPLSVLLCATEDRCMLPPHPPGTPHLMWWDDA